MLIHDVLRSLGARFAPSSSGGDTCPSYHVPNRALVMGGKAVPWGQRLKLIRRHPDLPSSLIFSRFTFCISDLPNDTGRSYDCTWSWTCSVIGNRMFINTNPSLPSDGQVPQ